MSKGIIGIIVCVLAIIIGIIYITSSNSENEVIEDNANKESTSVNINENTKSLVVYFSVPETDNPNNMTRDEDNSVTVVNGEVLGNTQYVANLIGDKTNSTIWRIEPKDPYPTNHEELLQRAREEIDSNARPDIKDSIDISDYDVVYIGYPIWNSDLPPIIYTFIENHDLNNKTIFPFCTHGGSGLSNTVSTLVDKLPNSTVLDGFEISRNNMDNADKEVSEWLEKLGY